LYAEKLKINYEYKEIKSEALKIEPVVNFSKAIMSFMLKIRTEATTMTTVGAR
jgi:hypothetical protein